MLLVEVMSDRPEDSMRLQKTSLTPFADYLSRRFAESWRQLSV